MTTPNDLMRHALGVQRYGERWSKTYRNYFVADGADADMWRILVEDGKAELVREGDDLSGGCTVYRVTALGRAHALAGLTFKRRYGYGRPVNP